MSLRAITWAFDQHDTNPTQRLLLLAYGDFANSDDEAWPSIETLVEKTGYSKATIYRARTELCELGKLEKLETRDHYRICLTERKDFSEREKDSQSEKSTNKGTVKNPKEPGVDRVWERYAAVMEPRRKEPGADERKIIREALKVATVEECERAIDGCGASAFHMGDNDKGRKYNALSQILRGKRGRQTVRERIDYFIDLAEKGGRVTAQFPSEDRALVMERIAEVQRGHRSQNADTVQRAKDAEAWLRQRGIKAVPRKSDGYPTFPQLAS